MVEAVAIGIAVTLLFVVFWQDVRAEKERKELKEAHAHQLREARGAWGRQREMYENRIAKLKAGLHEADPLPEGAKIEGGRLHCRVKWLSEEEEAALEDARRMN